MKKEKGFTLIELIAVVIILGLIALIAIPYFTGSMKTFRSDFYDNLSRTVETAGKEFFKDNTKYLPSKNLHSSKVSLNNLINQKYINNSDDYEGNECDLEKSYVIVIKKDKSTYEYTACIVCPGDDYTTFSQSACDGSWGENENLTVELGDLPDAYIYLGSSREEAYEKLRTAVDIVKKNYQGQVIGRVSGEEAGGEELFPVNIDILDTTKLGTYNLQYEFQGAAKTRKVHVYDNLSPMIAINKNNILKSGNVNNNDTVNDTGVYDDGNSNIWGQKLVFKFTRNAITEPGVEVHDYQWFVNNKWETICDNIGSAGACTVTVSHEMVEDVKFRFIDTNGNISRETRFYNIRIDNTKPSCGLSFVNPDGNNGWYIKDFNVSVVGIKDNPTISIYNRQVVSGIRRHGVGVGGTSLSTTLNSDTKTQTADSKSFVWYGYVEDLAGNWFVCNSGATPLMKDKTKPSCTLTSSGHKGNNNWYDQASPEITFSSTTDPTSGVDNYGFNAVEGSKKVSLTWDTRGATFTGVVRDKAGNTNQCTLVVNRDTVNPNLSYTKTATGTGGVTARINCQDDTSGCNSETHSGLKSNTWFTVWDNAGHSSAIEVPVKAETYHYTHCVSVHHYCTRTHCNWHADTINGSRCDYWEETYDCYERDCYEASGITYK